MHACLPVAVSLAHFAASGFAMYASSLIRKIGSARVGSLEIRIGQLSAIHAYFQAQVSTREICPCQISAVAWLELQEGKRVTP